MSTSQQPYFVRAVYDWVTDNQYTPYLMVDATAPDVQAPLEYAQDGKIVFNISKDAVVDLELGNSLIRFKGTFSEQPWDIVIPIETVMAVYARENGQGLVFSQEMREAQETAGNTAVKQPKSPDFRVVK